MKLLLLHLVGYLYYFLKFLSIRMVPRNRLHTEDRGGHGTTTDSPWWPQRLRFVHSCSVFKLLKHSIFILNVLLTDLAAIYTAAYVLTAAQTLPKWGVNVLYIRSKQTRKWSMISAHTYPEERTGHRVPRRRGQHRCHYKALWQDTAFQK